MGEGELFFICFVALRWKRGTVWILLGFIFRCIAWENRDGLDTVGFYGFCELGWKWWRGLDTVFFTWFCFHALKREAGISDRHYKRLFVLFKPLRPLIVLHGIRVCLSSSNYYQGCVKGSRFASKIQTLKGRCSTYFVSPDVSKSPIPLAASLNNESWRHGISPQSHYSPHVWTFMSAQTISSCHQSTFLPDEQYDLIPFSHDCCSVIRYGQ